jgi:metallo-beta-lactamase class B
MILRTFLLLFASGLMIAAQNGDPAFPPHKVVGNIYYVGSTALSSYLITTPQGHILINSSFEETVPLIRGSVEKLGFKFGDIKILLDSHAHGDHVAGSALVKQLTGARVMVMKGDEGVVSSGGGGDFFYNERWKPCPVDKVLQDGEKVSLGGTELVAHLTPGHTRGNTTWTMAANENGKTYQVVIIGSPNVNPGFQLVNNAKYPEIADDFARTFRVLKALRCDVFLGAHGAYYDMAEKYARLGKGGENPFVDPAGYREFVKSKEETYLQKLKDQKKGGK